MIPNIIFLLFLHLFFLPSHANFEAKPESLSFSEAPFSYSMRARSAYDELGEEQCPLLLNTETFMGSSREMGMVINVDDYGAKGGGTDDTQAFGLAWETACSSENPVSLVVPKNNTYLLKPITFSGPCKSEISVMIEGTIEASSNTSDWNSRNRRLWILFSNLENLTISGGGTINGNGQVWWRKSCKIDKSQPCKGAPTALTFRSCKNLRVNNLHVKDSQQIHVEFLKCSDVLASSLTINSSEKSPNTDGIHVSKTKNIHITDCSIATGDDCISIVSGSHDVKVTNILCGPGHGISIGSLGAKKSRAQVSDVYVDTAQLRRTSNGVRIKTWQGGKGYAKDIVFENINMDDVKNPIIIDQNYCDNKKKCKQEKSTVGISNVKYKSIKGTSASKIAISFNCSESIPCRGIVLQDIDLVEDGDETESFCENVEWSKKGTVIPQPCTY